MRVAIGKTVFREGRFGSRAVAVIRQQFYGQFYDWVAKRLVNPRHSAGFARTPSPPTSQVIDLIYNCGAGIGSNLAAL